MEGHERRVPRVNTVRWLDRLHGRPGSPVNLLPSSEAVVLARRAFEDGWNKQNLALFDEVFAADHVDHSLPTGLPPTREGLKQFASMYWSAFPDTRLTIENQVAEGDKVVTRFTGRGTHQGSLMGIAPTGKQVVVEGINVDRVAGGKIVETWGQFDQLGLLQQLGAVPAMGQPTVAAR